MQGGVIGGVCLLAFLLSVGRTEELESKVLQDVNQVNENVGLRKSGDLEVPGDLKNEISLAVSQSNLRASEGRSGDVGQSDSRSFEDSAASAVGQTNGDGYASANADSVGGATQAKSFAASGGAPGSQFNPFNEELGPYIPPGSGFSQAEAQAINSDVYGQGNSYPNPASYPYSSGLPPQGNGYYQPPPNMNPQGDGGYYHRDPVYNAPGQGLSPSQVPNQADNGLYQPRYNDLSNVSPYNQGFSYPTGDSESNQHIIEPNSFLPNPPQRQPVSKSLSTFSSSYPYSPGSDTSAPFQPVPIPNPNFSPYDRFLVPYKRPGQIQTEDSDDEYQPVPIIEPKRDRPNNAYGSNTSHFYSQNEQYQAVPISEPNLSSNEAIRISYQESSRQQSEPDFTQPDTVSRLYNDRSDSAAELSSSQQSSGFAYNSVLPESTAARGSYQDVLLPNPGPYESNMANMVPYLESSYSQKEINTGPYQSIPISKNLLRTTEEEIKSDQPFPVPDPYLSRASYVVPYREENSEKIKLQNEDNAAYQPSLSTQSDAPLSSSSTPSVTRSRDYNALIDDTDSTVDLVSKNGWDPYRYNPKLPSGAYPQLYPSGADAVQSYPDFKPATSHSYSQGMNLYVKDYPSESPIRPAVYDPTEAKIPPNVFPGGQSSLIAFEDANSRPISPGEYIFPNKMPGGENAVKCTKENEFHHFWSQAQDCMVCICLNEYGLLQPVCASCGGCQNPPPKLPEPFPQLPEPIPVQPATLGPIEPMPIMPDPIPVPQPEPKTEPPVPEPVQTVPTPVPYPVNPEPVPTPSPVPVTFPEPVPTLPPPPEQSQCSPLPTGVPFTNPLHPCQICICRENLVTGKIDVQIECKENPQCIAPSEVTALPPIPDEPVPIPLPICDKFPENVLFPHPTDGCKLCKCAKNMSEAGVYEPQITCYPHPDCIPKLEAITEVVPPLPIPVDPYQEKPFPVPEPLPIEPLREPPMQPVPLPEVVTVEPLPWPPITTVAPVPPLPATPRPGPLPGPSPHESCRPFPPNQAFQHPWDECQLCICSEATAIGMITVEVNCYTKPSCCIDPPESVKNVLPGKQILLIEFSTPYLGPPNAKVSDVQALSSSSPQPQSSTTTFRPPPIYPSYSPGPPGMYPGTNTAADPLNQASPYSGFVDPASSYPYQPNFPTPYGNPQYPEYPPRLPVLPASGNTIAQFKPNNFGYPANYQYGQGDAVGNNFQPQGHYQSFDPRFQTVPAQSYPGIYQRAYDRPHVYTLRETYVKPPIPVLGGPSLHNLVPKFAAPMGYAKSGKEGPDDDSR